MGRKGPGRPLKSDTPSKPGSDAFGRWLDRSLREQFSDVLREPVPDSLLDIIDADRIARQRPEPAPADPEQDRPNQD